MFPTLLWLVVQAGLDFGNNHLINIHLAAMDTLMKLYKKGGDYEPEREFNPDTDIQQVQIKKINRISIDLAGGDRENKLVAQGRELFKQVCSLWHFIDQNIF